MKKTVISILILSSLISCNNAEKHGEELAEKAVANLQPLDADLKAFDLNKFIGLYHHQKVETDEKGTSKKAGGFNFSEFLETSDEFSDREHYVVTYHKNGNVSQISYHSKNFLNFSMNMLFQDSDFLVLDCHTYWDDYLHKKNERRLKGIFVNDIKKKRTIFISFNASTFKTGSDSIENLESVFSVSALSSNLTVLESYFYRNSTMIFFVTCDYNNDRTRTDNLYIVNSKLTSKSESPCNLELLPAMNTDDVFSPMLVNCSFPVGKINKRIKDELPSWFWDNKIY